MDYLNLQYEKINIQELYEKVVASNCGAVASFVGITRNNFDGKHVEKLFYECYDKMAFDEMKLLCFETRKNNQHIENILIYHRLGEVPISEISVAIYVSSAHRRDALEAVSYLIDQLKLRVPIWKKEFYIDGNSSWKENPTS